MLIMDQTHAKETKQVLKGLRTELRQLAIGERFDHTTIESIRGFITFNRSDAYYKTTRIELKGLDHTQCEGVVNQVERLRNLSASYLKYFDHYWKCYEEGNTLAKYDMISYGESYVIAVLEVIRLEDKLFNLTTKDSIVQ